VNAPRACDCLNASPQILEAMGTSDLAPDLAEQFDVTAALIEEGIDQLNGCPPSADSVKKA
jgi:hypothetical protein